MARLRPRHPESVSDTRAGGPRARASGRGQLPRLLALFPVLALVVLVGLLPTASAARRDCLKKADYETISRMFSDGGPGTKVFLCPGNTYEITGPISFTAADQELATLGYPTGDKRAVIRVAEPLLATAIRGDCRRCARISIRNVIVDGNRSIYGRVRDPNNSPGLIIIGGNEGQSVKNCKVLDPRGFTAVHVREGDQLGCRGAVIEGNDIGPVGEEFDPLTDGPDPELSPYGRPLADGISIACRDSIVRNNKLRDCTDAGIVLYCSPGTQVTNNKISTERLSAMGGIFMVDATPFDGDYTGVMVKDNTLTAAGRAMRVGIGIGLSILSDDIDTILRGGSVVANGFQGDYMGFGIAAAGLKAWTIKDNWSKARHQGKATPRCFEDPVNPDPLAFLYHKATIKRSTIQPEFVDSDFAYVVCIDGLEEGPPPEFIEPREPLPEDDGPKEQAPPAERAGIGGMNTGSDELDGILLFSQMRMLEVIGSLGQRIDAVSIGQEPQAEPSSGEPQGKTFQKELAGIDSRLQAVEELQKTVLQSSKKLRAALRRLSDNAEQSSLWQGDVLERIQQAFDDELLEHEGRHDLFEAAPKGILSRLSGGITIPVLGIGATLVVVVAWAFRRRRKGRDYRKLA